MGNRILNEKLFFILNPRIADDHALFLEGLSKLVSRIEDVHLVGDVKNNKQIIIELYQSQKPDLILMDLGRLKF